MILVRRAEGLRMLSQLRSRHVLAASSCCLPGSALK